MKRMCGIQIEYCLRCNIIGGILIKKIPQNRKVIAHNEETIKPYEYLINFNECEKRIEGYEV